jgi:hypothetical protein
MAPLPAAQAARLRQCTSCDLSDALIKLGVPTGGFIPDLKLQHRRRTRAGHAARPDTHIGLASTVLFLPTATQHHPVAANIPATSHWSDMVGGGALHHALDGAGAGADDDDDEADNAAITVVIAQPPNQASAVVGGIMATRLARAGTRSLVVHGRVRDRAELAATGLGVWSLATSSVGGGSAARAWAVDVPVVVGGVMVRPGDVVCCDAGEEAVVVIPRELVAGVLELVPDLVARDERVKDAVRDGIMGVAEAFARFR